MQKKIGLLRIVINAHEKHHGKPDYEVIIEKAKKSGLHGAVVLRAVTGFGADAIMHTDKILNLSEGMPVVVEVYGDHDQLHSFVQDVSSLLTKAIVTEENATIITAVE